MRGSHPTTDMALIFRVVAAEYFHQRAQQRVADQVRGKNLAIEFFPAIKPGQPRVQSQAKKSLIYLRRMYTQRFSRTGREKIFRVLTVECRRFERKVDGPGQIARAPVATPGHQAADTAKHVTQGNTRRQDVGSLPKRDPGLPRIKNIGERSANEPAVVDQPAAPESEHFPERFAREFLLPESY